eukprot:4436734-Prorocentrum_lima.AAC.1
MLEHHFGDGYSTCPMAGKRASKCARGVPIKVVEEAWAIIEREMYSEVFPHWPLAPDSLAALRGEMLAARSSQVLLVRTKIDYWARLPCVLAA